MMGSKIHLEVIKSLLRVNTQLSFFQINQNQGLTKQFLNPHLNQFKTKPKELKNKEEKHGDL